MFQNQSSRQTVHTGTVMLDMLRQFCFLLIKTFTDSKVILKAKHYTFIFRVAYVNSNKGG